VKVRVLGRGKSTLSCDYFTEVKLLLCKCKLLANFAANIILPKSKKTMTFKTTLIACCYLFFTFSAVAQTPNRIDISGVVTDTLGEPLPGATVMLLSVKDTTLVNFTRSDGSGRFNFKFQKNQPYLLKVTYISFLPFTLRTEVSEREKLDLGQLKQKPIANELMEVVIRAAQAPLRIHGDTIEYDASTFKVPPGSTVEDLLRRLPGIEVDAAGNIKAQGRDVNRVYVDGKTFFGDNAQTATQNLNAEAISKVQVFDEKSQQEQLTGVADGKDNRVMNLELKEDYKKGAFGKVTAAGGTDDRWALRGNYNRFNATQQISVIGYGNNINQSGVNWSDYREFMGQTDVFSRDNGDFGFSNGTNGGSFYFSNDDEFGGTDSPVSFGDGRGLSENYGSGLNYNFDNKKTIFNGNYFYKNTEIDLLENSRTQYFLVDDGFSRTDTTIRNTLRGNHTFNARLEQKIDSNKVLILSTNFSTTGIDFSNRRQQYFFNVEGEGINNLNINNTNENRSLNSNSFGLFTYRFPKKGRSLMLSANYLYNQQTADERQFSSNVLFAAPTEPRLIEFLHDRNTSSRTYKSSVQYTEPLMKALNWSFFYNFQHYDNLVNRQSVDADAPSERIDSLSRFFDNKITYQRAGTNVSYNKNGINAAVGVAGQQYVLQGAYALDEGLPWVSTPLRRTFPNIVPYFSFDYEFANNLNIDLEYEYGVQPPTVSQLQPVVDVGSPLFQRVGNPQLNPAIAHEIALWISRWNPSNQVSFNLNSNFRQYESFIIDAQTTVFDAVTGFQTISQPVNLPGNRRLGYGGGIRAPIIKTRLSWSLNGNGSWSDAPTLVNGDLSNTINQRYNLGTSLTATLGTKLFGNLNYNFGNTFLRYTIQPDLNQVLVNQNVDATLQWMFLPKTFFEGNFNYGFFRNERLGFRQEQPILNGSIKRLLGKTNQYELRLAAFDLFNRRLNINQFGNQNQVVSQVSNTLTRYFMLSVSYNVRGYESKVKRNTWE
jgi:Outer membrane protein beta-barrel family/Carboxypeptidase regulatory-like domain